MWGLNECSDRVSTQYPVSATAEDSIALVGGPKIVERHSRIGPRYVGLGMINSYIRHATQTVALAASVSSAATRACCRAPARGSAP